MNDATHDGPDGPGQSARGRRFRVTLLRGRKLEPAIWGNQTPVRAASRALALAELHDAPVRNLPDGYEVDASAYYDGPEAGAEACEHESVATADGHGVYCGRCGETIA